MHFHLTNCHGEWTALAWLATSAPLVLVWLRAKFAKTNTPDQHGG